MASITTRQGKGSRLTHNELDANFTNLNADKAEKSGTDPVVISVNSASDALRVTQTGSGNALVVEDSVNPDSTPFVIDSAGYVVAGATSATNAGGLSPIIQTHSTSVFFAAPSSFIWSNDNQGAYTLAAKSRGTALNSQVIVQNADNIGQTRYYGSDGVQFIEAARIGAAVDGTPGTNDMPGRLVFSTTADGASSPTERMRIDSAGRVGISATPSAGQTFIVARAPTGTTTVNQVLSQYTVQSDVTVQMRSFASAPSTAAAAFTLGEMHGFHASQATIGATSVVTNQYGFTAASNLIGATNNYGFYSNIAAATGRWNFYANGTAANYFGGPTTVSVNSSSDALTITQAGSGNALVVSPAGVNPTYDAELTPSVAWSKTSWSNESTTSSATFTGLTIDQTYQIDWSNQSGSYTFNLNLDGGTAFANARNSGNKSATFVATATSHVVNIVPTGNITAVITTPTVKRVVTKGGAVAVLGKDAEGASATQLRVFDDTLSNTASGVSALNSNTTGYSNTASGVSALYSNTTGYQNTASGVDALRLNTTGYSNAASGMSALRSNTTGNYNTASGVSALYSNTTGYQNTANGMNALFSNTTGYYNTASGMSALNSNTTGYSNTANGLSALYLNTTGYNNTASGMSALNSNTTGYSNTASGMSAGRYAGSGTTANQTSNNSVYLGYQTRASADGNTNEIVIGYDALGNGSNTATIGNSSITATYVRGLVSTGDLKTDKTVTASGTTGAQTINKTAGSVNFAAAATSLVVTNNLVTSGSIIIATVATNDSTMKSVAAVAASGSFTLYANAAATAETRVNFIVVN